MQAVQLAFPSDSWALVVESHEFTMVVCKWVYVVGHDV